MTDRKPSPESDLDAALAKFREQWLRGQAPEIDAYCRAHAELGPELRRRLDEFLYVGQGLRVTAVVEQIGPYRILERIGEGGMGTVYLAEQKAPVRRRVALKVVKLGMDSKAVLTRFEAERRALSMMEHSCIATVFDAGITEHGRPYFAMEYVKGIPITDYCDQNKLGLQERIELFRKVCSGVQHAHLKGVMHRDLKPSNVLVTLQDGQPTPKLIDFGLAKATDHHLVEATLFTEHGQILGTPEYMSPEQAGLGGLDVDTRTDVYSLGVLLYELLVGELPFSKQALRQAGYLEMQRLIREQEPVKPSTKITSLGDAATQHAAVRRVSLGDLQRELRGDLDWIVLKALEKDRTRRYETALELAADLERHLKFEPVLASPPSSFYRLRKFVRRYRLQCIAGAIVFVAIVGGGIGTAVGFAEAREQARIAGVRERQAKDSEARATAGEARAKEQEQIASERADRIEKMLAEERKANERNLIYADVTRLAEARLIEATLYPAWPGRAQAIQDWLATYGEPLEARLPELGAALDALRQRALPRAPTEPAVQRESHPLFPELERRRSELEGEDEGDFERRDWLRERIATIDNEMAVAEWKFADAADGNVHRTLQRLVTELRSFTGERGALAGVRARLAEAQTVRAKTVDAWSAEWDQAIAAIRASDGETASELYQHFELTPQVGLVPIGMDRESKLWEFVHLGSGTAAKEIPQRDPATGRLVPTGDMGLVFVLLPGGLLPVEDGAEPDHRHGVRLDPFFVSKYEMTQGQWMRLSGGENPSRFKDRDNSLVLPVEGADWFQCEELLRHQGFVLPTELQWEYGCRGGTTTPWWCGADEKSLEGLENVGSSSLSAVGSLAANPFGLFDVAGNVVEWCLDEFEEDGTERHGDGLRPPTGSSSSRVVRGGGFNRDARNARSGLRTVTPAKRFICLGLRPARASRLDH